MNSVTTALTNIRRTPYQSLVAILIMSLTFFVGYAFAVAAIGAEQLLQYFEQQPQAIGFFTLDATPEQISQAQTTMEGKPYVTQVSIVSKEDALKMYQQSNQEDPLLLELVTAEILPASIEVAGANLESLSQIKQDLEAQPGVEEVAFQQDIIQSLSTVTNSIRSVGLSSILALSCLSLLTIIVVTSFKITSKRGAVQIMQIIGASGWFIKSPFIWEGVVYGLLGSLIGWACTYVGLLYATPWLSSFLGAAPILPFPLPWLLALLGAGSVIGMLLGSLASAIAVQRVMRKS